MKQIQRGHSRQVGEAVFEHLFLISVICYILLLHIKYHCWLIFLECQCAPSFYSLTIVLAFHQENENMF